LSLVFGLISLGLFGLSFHDHLVKATNTRLVEGLTVDGNTRSFGTLGVGDEAVVCFSMKNVSGHALRVLGSDAVCYQAACLEPKNLPLTIAPGGTGSIEVKVLARNPGQFSKRITVYTDCDGYREVLFGVRGNVIELKNRG